MIYLDNSATTYPKPTCVYEALDYANRNLAFNAGRGNYSVSNQASKIIDETRESIASFVKADARQVSFVSSATEALNLIILGLHLEDGDCVYISPFEHNAIVRPLYTLKNYINIEILILPFNTETWEPNLPKIEEMFSIKNPKAIFISQLSNVTGLLIDYEQIFAISKQYNCVTILDSAQSFGIKNPNLDNVDFCVFAGHKSLYASFGVAGIISKKYKELKVIKSGGNGSNSLNHNMPDSGPERIESGSPNIVAIYGLLTSSKWLKNNDVLKHEEELTKYLIKSLSSLKKIIVYKPSDISKLLGIVSFNVEGYLSDDVATILNDEFEIATRSGYHCSPFVHNFIDSEKYNGTVRISLGAFNTHDDIDQLICALKSLWGELLWVLKILKTYKLVIIPF